MNSFVHVIYTNTAVSVLFPGYDNYDNGFIVTSILRFIEFKLSIRKLNVKFTANMYYWHYHHLVNIVVNTFKDVHNMILISMHEPRKFW